MEIEFSCKFFLYLNSVFKNSDKSVHNLFPCHDRLYPLFQIPYIKVKCTPKDLRLLKYTKLGTVVKRIKTL